MARDKFIAGLIGSRSHLVQELSNNGDEFWNDVALLLDGDGAGGGGGAGSYQNGVAGAGGSGIVVIRYLT